jgi:hypothetical protein
VRRELTDACREAYLPDLAPSVNNHAPRSRGDAAGALAGGDRAEVVVHQRSGTHAQGAVRGGRYLGACFSSTISVSAQVSTPTSRPLLLQSELPGVDAAIVSRADVSDF